MKKTIVMLCFALASFAISTSYANSVFDDNEKMKIIGMTEDYDPIYCHFNKLGDKEGIVRTISSTHNWAVSSPFNINNQPVKCEKNKEKDVWEFKNEEGKELEIKMLLK